MILDILPLAGGAARLVRVYGGEPCAVLPGAVPGPEGGEWPITELGDYCFSEKPRGLPGPEKTCRYERAEDGKLCLTRAFGRDVSGKERYSFDFDAPAAPAQTGGAAAMARAAWQELGYSPVEISAALKGVDPGASTEEMVRFALRAMVMKG